MSVCPIPHRPWVNVAAWAAVALCLLVILLVPSWWSLWLFVTALYLAATHPLCRYVDHRRKGL